MDFMTFSCFDDYVSGNRHLLPISILSLPELSRLGDYHNLWQGTGHLLPSM